jgi:hypothetical protein
LIIIENKDAIIQEDNTDINSSSSDKTIAHSSTFQKLTEHRSISVNNDIKYFAMKFGKIPVDPQKSIFEIENYPKDIGKMVLSKEQLRQNSFKYNNLEALPTLFSK